MRSLLQHFGLWLARWAGWTDPVCVRAHECDRPHADVDPLVLDTAKTLVTQEETERPDAGYGEAKRHRVYGQLLKAFPDHPKRELSWAIEAALVESP